MRWSWKTGRIAGDITLLPIGGVARLGHIPEEPRRELLISFAGPAVTLGIIVVLYVALRLFGLPAVTAADDVLSSRGGLLSQLVWANLTLLVFNLLRAFPMDDGRVLRAGLALRMDYVRATDVAPASARRLRCSSRSSASFAARSSDGPEPEATPPRPRL